jgi:hypothetical protein
MRKLLIILSAAVFVFCLTGISHAAILPFFGEDLGPLDANSALPNSDAARNDFLSKLIGVGTEDFEGISTGTSAPLILNFGLDTATLTGDGTIRDDFPISSAGRFPTSGTQYWSTNSSSNNFIIDFSSPQAAFGFYGTDIGDFEGQLHLELSDGTVTNLEIPHTSGAPNASAIYFGVIVTDASEIFNSVAFSSTNETDFFGFDDMTIGRLEQVVPIPGAVWLLGSGLVGLVGLRKKLKK